MRPHRLGLRAVLPLALAALLGSIACAKKTDAPTHVVIGISTLRISLPAFVAVDRGLFAKRGLDVEVKPFDTAQPLADELAAGRLDAAGYVAFPILFGREGGPPKMKLVTAIVEDAQHPLSYLLVKKGSGLKGVAALKGKNVGLLPTVAYRKWMEAILAHDGLAPGEVTLTPVAPPMEVEMLANGGIDALFTGDPMATAAIARGVAERASDTPDVPRVLGEPFPFGTFAVSEQLATEKPAAAAAIRDALDEAIGLIAADQSVGRAALASRLREAERAWAGQYPDARYLASKELGAEKLAHALELAGSKADPKDYVLP